MVDFERIADFCIDNECDISLTFQQNHGNPGLFAKIRKAFPHGVKNQTRMFSGEDIEYVGQTGYIIMWAKDALKEMEE